MVILRRQKRTGKGLKMFSRVFRIIGQGIRALGAWLGRTTGIEALVKNGSQFYSEEKDSDGNYIGVAVALQKAYDKMGNDAVIASNALFNRREANADKNYLYLNCSCALRKNAGIDKRESWLSRGRDCNLLFARQGILTPERIRQAYSEGLTRRMRLNTR